MSLDLTEIDHLYERARASWTRRDLIKTRLFLFRITVPYLLIFWKILIKYEVYFQIYTRQQYAC